MGTDQNLKNLHEATMEVIETSGVRLHHDRLLEIAQSKGIKVKDKKVFFTREQLMEWVGKAPCEFKIFARNPANDMTVGGDHIEHVSYNSGFPYIADMEGTRRMALFSDYMNFVKLVHTTPFFNINCGVMVTPDDIPNDDNLYPRMLYATLLHSDKCMFGGMGGKTESQVTMEMLKIMFDTDKEGLIKKPRIINLVSSLSPLQFDEKMLDTLLVYVEHGQPVIIAPAVMAGSTGPMTMAGAIVISNAESLVGVAITQLVRPGTPVVYGSATANTDMKSGAFTIGTPESALAVKYCARLAKMYGVPCRGGGTLNDAKNLSVQAGYESMMVQFVANQEKINFNFHSAGGLDSYGSMSYEKFVTDLDILGRIKYYLNDLNTDTDHLAVDVINQVGVGGEYITNMHTAMNCRKTPFLSDISVQGPAKAGTTANEALVQKMHKKLDAMYSAYKQPEIDRAVVEKLDAFMQSIDVDLDQLKEKISS
ncbi:trimethylamine---corrinoid protein Co-methyltransferase [Desulfocicer vacuolatum DSM 3385]|uniref:Methyltransferase n=1 Tax=Desulfocicer vacuolatum DSM 3385 TaxID=1121400 RepID=A0A1W2ATU5_9BACT|nr:trimethylamine methyltransferase family protein [Desulfocicer vacuolatum]SMC63871.1 trimethylamine---corrinoid protein Co-methyltransferase [Desulfocicer vacuolatum DSM 3385]